MRKLPLDLIKRVLEEDGAEYDITTLSTVPEERQAQASIIARQEGVAAGLAVAAETFRLLDGRVSVELLVEDGVAVQPGQVLARLHGPARSILSAERVDRKSTRLNSSHGSISYAVFCLIKLNSAFVFRSC